MLFEFGIYTIRLSDTLATGRLREGRRWTEGERLFREARANRQVLPIIFADAADCSRLIAWARLTDVRLVEQGTEYEIADVQHLSGRTPQDLRLKSTARSIAPGFIRPYAIVHTPSFLEPQHFIAYHSVQRMGAPYGAPRSFGFWSRKRSALEHSVGNKVWVIEGDKSTGSMRYSLRAVFVPSSVHAEPDGDGFRIRGRQGMRFGRRPSVFLNSMAWFERLRVHENNFSFGFNRIKDGAIAAELLRLEREWDKSAEIAGIGPRPEEPEDARRRIEAEIVARQGQADFRTALMRAYGHRCAVSGWDVPESLEAAHIRPYRGPHSQRASNGILLRADLHTLFDLGLMSIDPKTHHVRIARELKGTQVAMFDGCPLRLPEAEADRPDRSALAERWSGEK